MRIFMAALAACLVLGLPAGALAQAPAGGTVSGRVINGTDGGGSVAGTEVSLFTYIDNMLVDTSIATADGEGDFRFDGTTTEYTYLVSANYMDVDYYYPVTFEPGVETAYVEVWVCDATDSDEKIRVGLSRKIVDVEEESLLITEVYWLVNDGDTTYLGTDGVLFFRLPPGAYDFTAPPEMMIDYQLREDNVITYLVPFPPGERQLVYYYRLAKPDKGELGIPLAVDYPTDVLEIMVAGGDIEVAVSQLAPVEPVVTDTGERYIRFQGGNFARGAIIDVRLSNFSGGGGFPLFVLWLVMAAAVAGTAVYLVRRQRKAAAGE